MLDLRFKKTFPYFGKGIYLGIREIIVSPLKVGKIKVQHVKSGIQFGKISKTCEEKIEK